MASAAEQLARNLNFSTFSKAKALQQRIWFTLGALLVYRLGTFIPVPGIDPDAFRATFEQSQQGILGMFNMFAGGAVERMAIFALNLIPYITASIVVQVIATASPRLEALKKEGEAGRRKMNQYTRYLAVVFCAVQAYGIAVGLEASQGVVLNPGWFFRVSTVITLVGGTMFLMWLGEQITSRGVGNGISLIIFAGIVANLPTTIVQTLELSRTGALPAIAGVRHAGAGSGGDRRHRVLRARPAPAADPVSKAPGRQQDVPGRQLASAAQAEYVGRYPGDLRLVAAAAAGNHCVVRGAG